MDMALIIGYLASACSVTSFVPQVIKVVKSGDTAAISARMYTVTVIGFALWSAFGVMRHVWTAPVWQEFCRLFCTLLCRSCHVSGLWMRHRTRPLAIMLSADRVPVKSPRSKRLAHIGLSLSLGRLA